MTKSDTSNKNLNFSPGTELESPRYTFSKNERLCKKRAFELLFEEGSSFYAGRFWAITLEQLPPHLVTSPLMVAFAAPRRSFKKAVDRNLIKRRMREAWRFHKADFLPLLEENNKNLAILVKYNSRKIHTFKEIEKDIVRVFRKLKEKI